MRVAGLLLTPEQRAFGELRRQSRTIGSSDAAGVLNCSPWTSPYKVALDILSGQDFFPSDVMELGSYLESSIAGIYEAVTDTKLLKPERAIVRHDKYPWLHASPDRVTSWGKIVEIKYANNRDGWGVEGTDEVPENYAIQVQEQMVVMEAEEADIAVLLPGEFRIYHLRLRPDLSSNIIEATRDFHKSYIEAEQLPPFDWTHPVNCELIAKLQGFRPEVEVYLDSDQSILLELYAQLKKEEKDIVHRQKQLKARLFDAMGEAGVAIAQNGRRAYRKVVNRKAYNVKAGSHVQFRMEDVDDGEE